MKNIVFGICLIIVMGCGTSKKIITRQPPPDQKVSSSYNFNPKAVSHFIRACIHELNEDTKSALLEFQEALLYDSSSATIYNKVAEQYFKLKKYDSAEKIILKALRTHPRSLDSYRLLAAIYYSKGDLNNTEKIYRKILNIDPLDIEARYHLTTIYLSKGEKLKVAEEYEHILQLGGGNSEIRIEIGNIYIDNKKYDKAEKAFREFFDEHPDDERSYLAMAKLYLEKKDTLSAIDWYHRGLDVNQSFTTCLEELRDIYIRQQKWDEAVSLLKNFVILDSTNIDMRLRLGELYFQKKDTLAALAEFQKITAHFPNDFRAYYSIATLYYQQRDWEQAILNYQKSIEMKQDFRRGWLMLGLAYLRAQKLDEAEQHFIRAVEKAADDFEFNYFLGTVLHQQKKTAASIAYLEKCVQLEPENIEALGALALAYDELQNYEKSDSLYEAALTYRAEDPLLMNNYSYSLAVRGIKLEYALKMSQKAVAQDSTNGAYLDTIGWIYYKLGDYNNSLTYLQLSIKHRRDSAEVLEHLGDVYHKLNDKENARKFWQEAYDLDNSRSWLLDKLNEQN